MPSCSSSHAIQSFKASLFLVLVGVCAAVHIWKLPPALPLLQQEFGLDLVESGFLLSSVQLGGMSLGLVIGLFAERIGLRRCILIGLSILSLSSLGVTWFDHKTVILVGRAIEGCGFLMVVLPVPALIKSMVPAQLIGRIMSFWGCYMPIGAVVTLLAGPWLLNGESWRVLWSVAAAITLLILALLFFLLPSDQRRQAKKPANKEPSPSTLALIKTTLKSGRTWLVATIFGVYAAQWAAIIGFLPTFYATNHLSGELAGALTAAVAGSNIIGNLVSGRYLQAGIKPQKLLMTGFMCMLLSAFIAFGTGQGLIVQFVFIVLLSITGGLIPATLFFLAVTVAPSPQTTATTIGWVQQGSSLGQFLGPPVVAWVVSALGGWQWAWIATGAFALSGMALAWRLNIEAKANIS